MHRAIVELDPLTDADRPRTDDDGLLDRLAGGLVLLLVGRVEVGGGRIELGGAGVDHLVDRLDIPFLAQLAHLLRQAVGERADLLVGKTNSFCFQQKLRRQRLR